MKIGVFTVLFGDKPFEDTLDYVKELGLEAVEIGTGAYPGDGHCKPAELLKKFPAAKTPTGLYYNPYFANLNIAMPPPIVSDGQVTYADGTTATVDQMSQDVTAFQQSGAIGSALSG